VTRIMCSTCPTLIDQKYTTVRAREIIQINDNFKRLTIKEQTLRIYCLSIT